MLRGFFHFSLNLNIECNDYKNSNSMVCNQPANICSEDVSSVPRTFLKHPILPFWESLHMKFTGRLYLTSQGCPEQPILPSSSFLRNLYEKA